MFDGARVNIEEIAGERGEVLKRKFNTVVARNPNLTLLWKILGAMQGTANVPESVRVADISSYKFCPTASVDVERSFSVYKQVLTEQRHRLTEENIGKNYSHTLLLSEKMRFSSFSVSFRLSSNVFLTK